MRFPIDVIFLDKRGRVLGVVAHAESGAKALARPRGTRDTLELAAGAAQAQFAIGLGDTLRFVGPNA